MAIPKSKRTTTPLSVLVEADTLACYTILICTDESRFPKRYRWCLTQQIIESAIQAKMHIAKANSVYVNDRESATLRHTYQQEAIADAGLRTLRMATIIESSRKCITIIRVYGGMKMFRSITMEERLQKAETTNRALRSQLDQTSAQAAYIAMMSDVELPTTPDMSQHELVAEGGESDE